jgi:hypothetical protein
MGGRDASLAFHQLCSKAHVPRLLCEEEPDVVTSVDEAPDLQPGSSPTAPFPHRSWQNTATDRGTENSTLLWIRARDLTGR